MNKETEKTTPEEVIGEAGKQEEQSPEQSTEVDKEKTDEKADEGEKAIVEETVAEAKEPEEKESISSDVKSEPKDIKEEEKVEEDKKESKQAVTDETKTEEVKKEDPKDQPAEKVSVDSTETSKEPPKEAKQEAPPEKIEEAKQEAPPEKIEESKQEAPPEKIKEAKLDVIIQNGQVSISSGKVKLPAFSAGDTITVSYKIIEGDKERIQQFKGVVLQRRGSGNTETCTIRKVSGGIGIERIIPLCSPFIDKIIVHKRGKVRRARIFYLRKLKGKKARIDERRR